MTLTAGVDVGGTNVRAGLVDSWGKIETEIASASDAEAGTRSIVEALEKLFDQDGRAQAIGVGAAGWMNLEGKVSFSPNITYEDPDLRSAVQGRFPVPVVIENDANAAAWGEARFGAGRGASHVIMLTLGTGIGGGIILGGMLYRGSNGMAGELGHITIEVGGPECKCGQKGCLEAVASGTAIGRMARERSEEPRARRVLDLAGGDPQQITGATVSEAARAGDSFAAGVLEQAGTYLGAGLMSLVNIFDPDVIVIGGGAAEAGDLMLGPAEKELKRRLSSKRAVPPVVPAELGTDAGMIGAADLARASLEEN